MSQEIAAALGRFFVGGDGPRHSDLDAVFSRAGLADVAPYIDGLPNKEQRVRRTIQAACVRTERARELVDGLLAEMRAAQCFDPSASTYEASRLQAAQAAFRREGWQLSDEGQLRPLGPLDLDLGGRAALDEQFRRLQGSIADPALALGSAKDLLEAVAKFVIEEMGGVVASTADFNTVWYLARDRLGIHPKDLTDATPGGAHVRTILQSAWSIAEQTNLLRNEQGTGHGRTLPTGITAELAVLVVREACNVVEFTLSVLDQRLGRAR